MAIINGVKGINRVTVSLVNSESRYRSVISSYVGAMDHASNLTEADIQHSDYVTTYGSFTEMGIRPELLKGIYNYGFERPSLIQQKSIRPIIDGKDIIVQAQNGTGKTATYSIGSLQRISGEIRKTQVLVLSPTRELANQIHRVMSALSDYLPIRCVACCGGRSNVAQMAKELSKGAHVVVGTPGRVLDMARHGSLRLDAVQTFILDEADEMLNRGLRDQLVAIFQQLPATGQLNQRIERRMQVVIVSATLPREHLELIHQFTQSPVRILVPRDELSLAGIRQFYIDVGSEEWKFEALGDIFASISVSQTVVFVNTRRKVDWLSRQLRRDSFTVEAVHGELDQSMRETVMERFRSGASRVLVSSDVWARGIDVQNVGLVINYDLPSTPTDYLHRIGRSGRFGRRGLAVSLVTGAEDQSKLDSIARYYRIAIEPAPAALDKLMLDLIPTVHGSRVVAESDSGVPTAPIDKMILACKKKKKRKHKKKKKTL
ncbi:unnamed protein product [Dicrocoelium dendriticum]|nr:unnamed protein product [Dicrocoelium dendriticum]